jgi:hypothetical protein
MGKRFTYHSDRYDDDVDDYREAQAQLRERRRIKHLRRAMKTRNVDEMMDLQEELEGSY